MLTKTQEIPVVTMADLVYGNACQPLADRMKENTMGKRVMSDETKAKIAASRAAKKAAVDSGSEPATTRASLEDQIAAIQAQAEAGDTFAQQILPLIEVSMEQLAQAKATFRTDSSAAKRKIRKLISTLK